MKTYKKMKKEKKGQREDFAQFESLPKGQEHMVVHNIVKFEV